MIQVTGLDRKPFILNSDHIEKMEEVPDTIITLTNGKKYLVKESVKEVIGEIIEYKRKIFSVGL